MTIALSVVGAVLAVAAFASPFVTAAVLRSRRLERELVEVRAERARGLFGRTVTVNLDDNEACRGVLIADHADRYTLAQAFWRGEHAMEGLVHLPKQRVLFVQEHP